MSAWANFLEARKRLIHEWTAEGKPPHEIVRILQMDTLQVHLIAETDIDPLPPCGSKEKTAFRIGMKLGEALSEPELNEDWIRESARLIVKAFYGYPPKKSVMTDRVEKVLRERVLLLREKE